MPRGAKRDALPGRRSVGHVARVGCDESGHIEQHSQLSVLPVKGLIFISTLRLRLPLLRQQED